MDFPEAFEPSPLHVLSLPLLDKKGVQILLKRDDRLEWIVTDNKARKLKYNLGKVLREDYVGIATFGGAFSNHIYATARACHHLGIPCVGFIRTDKIDESNPTLREAIRLGMRLIPVNRSDYRLRADPNYLRRLATQYLKYYFLPEGGTNQLSLKGTQEILNEVNQEFDVVCCPVGSGGTIGGILQSTRQPVYGFSALKHSVIPQSLVDFFSENEIDFDHLKYISESTFGGFGRKNEELIAFINQFHRDTSVELDWLYNGKMFYTLFEMIKKDHFKKGITILIYVSGGLQGNHGLDYRYKKKHFNF